MTLFAPLRDLLRPKTPSKTAEAFSVPFGLKPEEWANLKALRNHDGWPVFLKAIDTVVKLHGDRMLASSDPAVLHFVRGSVAGLRKAAILIDEVARDEARHASEKTRLETQKDARADRTALFGSPGWRPKRKPGAIGA